MAVFGLEWVVLGLAFVLRYYAFVEGDGIGNGQSSNQRNGKVQDEDLKNWPWPFQVQRLVSFDSKNYSLVF